MRHIPLLVIVSLLAAACAAETVTPLTTTPVQVQEPSTTTTTVVELTTTTVAEPVDICRKGELWQPGAVYAADCFVVPVSFRPSESGWRSLFASATSIGGVWVDEMSGEVAGRFETWVYGQPVGTQVVLDSMVAIAGVSEVSERTAIGREGAEVVVVDLETEPRGDVVDFSGVPVECAQPSRALHGPVSSWPGYEVFGFDMQDPMGRVHGLGACRMFRVWAVDTQGETWVVVWTADEVDRFEELSDVADRLFDSMTFEAP